MESSGHRSGQTAAARLLLVAVVLVLLTATSLSRLVDAQHDYKRALELSFHFFEAQRSGYLPANQRVDWRANSALKDGWDEGVDLVGGYYDAGDNVKFQLPMAFTITALSWSVIEYRSQLIKQNQLRHALESLKWGTDYFIKAHTQPDILWVEVGDGDSDHTCWQRPEDMTTSRKAYKIDAENPGSEVAAETAAALAAASIVFQKSDMQYSASLLFHARQLFQFADTYRGNYDESVPIVRKYYASGPSKYDDELLWAAFWLFEATNDDVYLEYAVNNAQLLGGTGWAMSEFGWDVKYAGVQVLASKILLQRRGGNHTSTLEEYKKQAEFFMCSSIDRNGAKSTQRTPGGMLWLQSWNNLQFVTSAAFLLTVYGDYLSNAREKLSCPIGGAGISTSELISVGKAQIDYILGSNPKRMSYMVGFGANYPRRVHHRGASIISIKKDSTFVSCQHGYDVWYSKTEGDPNELTGAVVGGPDVNDDYIDRRDNWEGGEACTYNNALLIGVLARLSS
ncbi:hypothetical protein AXG93_4225s1320 [Marchantia polymorpha subsp. ruderalis]|uniref:Endoglucanase n=1 Tax=Marchantia polymorpha subsp. ruderalis TaxID=1480154 RepID=A0A176WRS3_MARPO|nr:hypothetical protein AXG93_4225s1320 [Marchantia polymorpha subsp. ruderalis]